jgi:pyruvate/2-oxoglutarate dehydrogenase complex dihydrolipoamide acyltransferase (E2) component
MKLTKNQETKLTEMAFAEKSNKEIAQELGIELKDVHAARSRLGITIPKVKAAKEKGVQPVSRSKEAIEFEIFKVQKAAKEKGVQPVSRSKEAIEFEIFKVQKARTEAFKKVERCNERIDQLIKELEG